MTKRDSRGFILPFQQFPQPLLVCSDEYSGLAFGWTCAPNGTEFKIVCADGRRIDASGAALFSLAGEGI